jgi:hypothetical protein
MHGLDFHEEDFQKTERRIRLLVVYVYYSFRREIRVQLK